MATLIDNDVTQRVLEMPDAIEAIEAAFSQLGRNDAAFYPRTDIVSPTAATGDYYVWGSLLGAIRDPPRLAFRFKSDILRWDEHDGHVTEEKFNVEPGTFMGFILLFDTSTGELLGLLNDGALQHVRVGATAGVACDQLARRDASQVGILGSGGMAESYLRAFDVVRDLESVSVYSPTASNRDAFAERLSESLDLPVEAVDSAEAAVTDVDIAACCTDASQPVYHADWLEDGLFLVDVRSIEVAPDAVSASDATFGTATDGYMDRGIGSPDDLARFRNLRGVSGFQRHDYPTLDEVLTDPDLGRSDDDETIYYHNRSAGIQFASVGDLVYDRATQAGLGTAIPIEWFQQDIRD
jgi:ornithine cyclodeaminase/alanine dehydrogenase-like protein (mu-crystallin family)